MKNLLKLSMVALLALGGQCFGMELCMVSPEFCDWVGNIENRIEDAFGGETLPNLTEEKISDMSLEQLDFFVQHSKKAKEKMYTFFEKHGLPCSDISLAYLCAGPKTVHFLMKQNKYSHGSFAKGSPTAGHFGRIFEKLYKKHLAVYIPFYISNNFDIRSCLLKGVLAQKRETKKGNFAYFHAQNSSLFVPQFIFAHLLELYYDKPLNKEAFWALRFNKPGTNLSFLKGSDIIQQSSNAADFQDVISYKHFMNCSLFGNTTQFVGSDFLTYFKFNFNVGVKYVKQDPESLFNMFDWGKYFLMHQAEFNEIELLADAKNNQHGTLLLHVFDEKALKQFVYVAQPSGLKHSLTINGKKTHDVKQIYNTMAHEPQLFDSLYDLDQHEYVFVQTEDHPTDKDKLGSLNPFHPGIKTYHFTVQDMSDVKQKIAEVFVKIKKEMLQDKLDNK